MMLFRRSISGRGSQPCKAANSLLMADATPPMTILDLDPELLLHAIEYLSAKHQARAAQTCKLFAILVHEVARTTSFLASAVGPLSSTLQELDPRLESMPTLGILFTEDDYAGDSSDLDAFAKKLPYHMDLVGGQMMVVAGTNAAGELVQTERRRRTDASSVALHLGRFPEATCKSFVIDPRQGDYRDQLQAQGCLTGEWKVFLLVSLYNGTPDLVETLQEAHPGAAIIGGFASGDTLFRVRHRRAEVMDRGLVGLMFAGNVPLAAFVSRGARGLGEGPLTFGTADVENVGAGDNDDAEEEEEEEGAAMAGGRPQLLTHVTDAEGRREAALKAIIEVINSSSQTQGLSLGVADGPGEGYELVPLSNDMVVQDKMAIVLPPKRGEGAAAPAEGVTGWQSGGALRLYSFDPESCRQDLTRRLTELKAHCEAKGDRLLGAVMFTCGGRTDRFFGEPAFDASCFTKIMTGVPLIGMYAGGEIGPPLLAEAPASKAFQVGGAGMHGFTAVFGMFVIPERQARTSLLAFPELSTPEGVAAIAAAYAEIRANAPTAPPEAAAGSSSSPSAAVAAMLPSSIAELRAMPVKALKAAMAKLGMGVTPGSEKDDLIEALAPHVERGPAGDA